MKRKWLIIVHAFFLLSLVLIFFLGPFYSDYTLENLEGHGNDVIYPYTLNFTLPEQYILLSPTSLDSNSLIAVEFSATQPVCVVITDAPLFMSSSIAFYEKSICDVTGNLVYNTPKPDNYTVLAKGFGGTANFTVGIRPSIMTRNKPYALWGQIMYFGGIGLLIASVALVVISWLRKKQPPKTAVGKKAEKEKAKPFR